MGNSTYMVIKGGVQHALVLHQLVVFKWCCAGESEHTYVVVEVNSHPGGAASSLIIQRGSVITSI